ncbi:MAG TPA: hypothetical protein VMM18_01175 [Gemmatimonadaceae bacterium]|nr:hypothetical protein [Gemmatimonadaceae bacterium]
MLLLPKLCNPPQRRHAARPLAEAGRLRIGEIKVRLAPEIAEADVPRMTRCLEVFEDYCVVTQSVREGLEVSVQVAPTPRGTR